MVGVGALCPRMQALEAAVTAGVVLLMLLGVGLALAPLGRARAAEAPVLRLLGATDSEALYFAALEAGALGAPNRLAGALLAFTLGPLFGLHSVGHGSPETLALWLVAAGLAGAPAFRTARSVERPASHDRA